MSERPKIIVLDDDPTGSQTVHSCLLLMQWDVETLKLGLQDDAPIFFVLTNTRSQPPSAAERITREVCHNLKQAMAEAGTTEFLVVSRSDSTLRGHYPIETDVMAEELGPFDAHFMVPAFFEGGRVTLDSTHYIESAAGRTPVHQTEFAQDSVFGYRHSYLPDYVAEKTQGRIPAEQVVRFTRDRLQQGSLERLMQLSDNVCVAVDAKTQADLDGFAQDLLTAAARGKRFLFRSAASLLTSLADLAPQPVAATAMSQYARSDQPGAILVGSHVQKTTRQLEQLLQLEKITGIEVDITQLKADLSAVPALLETVLEQVQAAYQQQQTPAIYTSREELTFEDAETRLRFGTAVSTLLMDILRGLPDDISFLISKGGITSNDTLSQGLALRSARLLGQILPGVSLVMTPGSHPQFPHLPVVLFPGNVGDETAIATVYQRLQR
ncbi:MAG: four-carbon acid sugar kinase family protein [Leptolyngbya sp. SIO4C1]|nr:four-carbon acid sugar kinase family protein [Leptolyngbya sp. SIO4C1]